MKKIFTTILTIAVLGVGYVGAKAFERKVEVRQETRWFESADGSEHNYKDEPLPASFNPETDCQGVEQTCAGLFEVDANNNPMGTPLAIQAGELQ